MSTFPALIPSDRRFVAGRYPNERHPVLRGTETRVRLSSVMVESRLRLLYKGAPATDAVAVRDHYNGQRGVFLPFDIPAEVLEGLDDAEDLTLDGYKWRYIARPRIVDRPIPGASPPANTYDIEIQLESVPPENTIVSGARLRARSILYPGSPERGAFFRTFATITAGIAAAVDEITAAGAFLTSTATITAGAASAEDDVPDYSDKRLAILFEGADGSDDFVDSGASGVTIIPTNATITTSTAGEGTSSGNFVRASPSTLYFDPLASLNFGTGDFALRFKGRLATLPGSSDAYTVIRGLATFDSTVLAIQIINGPKLRFTLPWLGTSIATSDLAVDVDEWHDYKVSRTGTTISLEVDDVEQGSATFASVVNLGAGGTAIGSDGSGSGFNGQLDAIIVD
jgi:hypothetical protein